MEEELMELLKRKQLEAVTLGEENKFLQAKLLMLERVVPVRGEILRFLAAQNAAKPTPTSSDSSGSDASTSGRHFPRHIPSAHLQSRALLGMLDQPPSLHCISSTSGMTLAQLSGLGGTTQWEKRTPTNAAEFQAQWREFAQQLGSLVHSVEVHGHSSGYATRLEAYLLAALHHLDKHLLQNPTFFFESMYLNLDTGRREAPGDEFWASVARSLAFEPSQATSLKTAVGLFERNMGRLMGVRRELTGRLAGMADTIAPVNTVHLTDRPLQYEAQEQLLRELRRNVMTEHFAHWELGDLLCAGGVLKPYQVAKAIAASYPYIPDGTAIVYAGKSQLLQAGL